MTWTLQRHESTNVHGVTIATAGGPIGRLAAWAARHFGVVVVAWVTLVVALGAFAPRVFDVLAGAGWQANDSESVQVRELADAHFRGMGAYAIQVVIHSETVQVNDPAVQRVIADATEVLESDGRTTEVVQPQPGATISQDGSTAILLAGAGAGPDDMVKAVDELKNPLKSLSTNDVHVYPTGAPALWSDFNEANHDAMIKAELVSWPVTLTIMVVAFGSLVAAGLPLLLTMVGLGAAAGALVLINEVTPISIWAMNFALMFALALGIDYALFVVVRFRSALTRSDDVVEAVVETMDTAGKAVLLSGVTVLISLSAVLLVPAPAFRTMALGIMLSVVFVLLATLTLLPAVLGRLHGRVSALALPWATKHQHSSPGFERWARLLMRHPRWFALVSLAILVGLAAPVIGLRVSMPSISVVPADAGSRQGFHTVQDALGRSAPAALQIIVPAADAKRAVDAAQRTRGVVAVTPAQFSPDGSYAAIQAVPQGDPSDPALGDTLRLLRAELPPQALVGGFSAENIDLQQTLNDHLIMVMTLILGVSFVILLVALQAPLVALLGTVVSLLSTGAAFGAARLIFQNGYLAGFFDFTAQGFLDGWAPVFFFAMIFAIAMDYTVFLLSSAKEYYERTGDPASAVLGSLGHSGRVVFAAAAVMVAVFFTFALSDPLPPKEMGIILGIAVLLDAVLVRLILLPVLLRIVGQAAWWSPSWLRRALPKVTFAHG